MRNPRRRDIFRGFFVCKGRKSFFCGREYDILLIRKKNRRIVKLELRKQVSEDEKSLIKNLYRWKGIKTIDIEW